MKKVLHTMQRRINNLQTVIILIINSLQTKPLAVPLAKLQTLTGLVAKFRLRIQTNLSVFANVKPLYFKHLEFNRLQNRLQSCQLNLLTCLQVQADSFVDFKEKNAVNQPINQAFFAGLFVNNPN